MSGNYERLVQTGENLVNDRTCKRLLSAMQYGVIITHGDGHRWIYSYATDESDLSLNDRLHDAGHPAMRNKCYGSVVDALDRVDGVLKILKLPSLMETYEAGASYDAWG